MELIRQVVDLFLHLDKHLNGVIQDYGVWTYAILFLIIFCETGLVVTPILPGDSLLFATGTLAARHHGIEIYVIVPLLAAAAVLGDTTNYWIGYFAGPKVFQEKRRFLKKEYLDRTHAFYERYG